MENRSIFGPVVGLIAIEMTIEMRDETDDRSSSPLSIAQSLTQHKEFSSNDTISQIKLKTRF